MVENVIQMKSEIKICVDVIVKIQRNIISVNKIMFGFLVHVLVRLMNI